MDSQSQQIKGGVVGLPRMEPSENGVQPQSVVDNSGEFTNIAAEPGKKYFIAEVG